MNELLAVVAADMVNFNPKNWGDLADAAKFMTKNLEAARLSRAVSIHEIMGSPPEDAEQAANQLRLGIDDFNRVDSMQTYAYCLYLGASAAKIERAKERFLNEGQIIGGASEAIRVGILIRHLVETSRQLILTNKIIEKDEKYPDRRSGDKVETIEMQYADVSRMLDGSQRIMASVQIDQAPLRPKSRTVVKIVKDEIGILPEPIKQSIITIMALKVA